MDRQRIFICGHLRSGKTILQDILSHCPGVFITNETKVYKYIVNKSSPRDFFRSIAKGYNRVFKSEVDRYLRNVSRSTSKENWLKVWEDFKYVDNKIVGDKDTLLDGDDCYIERFDEVDPNLKIIYVQRDIRDIISIRLMKLKKRRGLFNKEPIRELGEEWLKTEKEWERIQHKFNHLVVKFEDMSNNKTECLSKISLFTEISKEYIVKSYDERFSGKKALINKWPEFVPNWKYLSGEVNNQLKKLGYS